MATTSRRRYNHVFSRFRIQLLFLAVWLLRTLPAQSGAFQWHARLSPSRDGHTTRVAVRKTLRAEMLPHLSIRRALQQQVDVSPTVAENQSVEPFLPGNANALQPQVSPPQNDAAPILALSDVTRKVTSAEQLSQAILDGAVHILITSHMDLHMLPATRPLVVSGTTSIRVCSAAYAFLLRVQRDARASHAPATAATGHARCLDVPCQTTSHVKLNLKPAKWGSCVVSFAPVATIVRRLRCGGVSRSRSHCREAVPASRLALSKAPLRSHSVPHRPSVCFVSQRAFCQQ